MTSLVVVGTGIQAAGQITVEARSAISEADVVLYLITDGLTHHYLESLNPHLVSLHEHYADDKPRMQSYTDMIDHILAEVHAGKDVCVALYGHPGVFAYPAHVAVQQLLNDGVYARMTPGISAEDCLFADLGVDPAWSGCQSFEATDFLLFERKYDPASTLILWQVGVIGDASFQASGYSYSAGVSELTKKLLLSYPTDHPVIIYEAAHYPIDDPRTDRVTLSELPSARLTPESTLYVPPAEMRQPNTEIAERIGMPVDSIRKVRMKVRALEAT